MISGKYTFQFALIFLLAARAGAQQQPVASEAHPPAGWVLVWSDEFNGKDGSRPDPKKWTLVTGGNGFGNQELESYTERPVNAHLEEGKLAIVARREHFTGTDGIAREYTSARLKSEGHFQTTYGRIEARIRIPEGKGLWPAFWMMGDDFSAETWPGCGEIDIMENVGGEPSRVHGSLHGPGYSGSTPLTGFFDLSHEAHFSAGFHRFTLEWEPRKARFYVDDVLYETQDADHLPPGGRWVFDHPFYLLLNLAVGGNWPGPPDASSQFPATMLVDYVRVYKRAERGGAPEKPQQGTQPAPAKSPSPDGF